MVWPNHFSKGAFRMGTISASEWERRKEFIGFGEEDIAILKELHDPISGSVDKIVDELYDHFDKFHELKAFLQNSDVVSRLKITQKAYFMGLLEGEYGEEYLNNRIRVGRAHQRIGLDVNWYIGAYYKYVEIMTPYVLTAFGKDEKKGRAAHNSLLKLINLDQAIAIITYINAREEVIAQQAEEIMELSTPVIQVWDGIVAAPIIGTLDSHRTQLFMERLLEAIVETKSPVALVDITGVPTIDTATAQHIIDTINAVKLLGAQVIITGVSPIIAQTLVHLGIDLSGILTRTSLAQGLGVALDLLNLHIYAKRREED